MSATLHEYVVLVLGLLLVTTPIWAPPLDVTGRDYEYRSTPVTVENNRLEASDSKSQVRTIADIGCFKHPRPSRLCGFESALINASAISAPYPGVRHVAGEPSLESPHRYVAFGDGRVFERTTGWNDTTEAYVLALHRANATHALAESASPARQYPQPIQRAVETGSARADDPLGEPVLAERDDSYYSIHTARSRSFLSAQPRTERLLELIAVIGGAFLLWTKR
jgi:hypothetical protein